MSHTITLLNGATAIADVPKPQPIAWLELDPPTLPWTSTRWQGRATIKGRTVTVQGTSLGCVSPLKWKVVRKAQPVPVLPKRAVRWDREYGRVMRSDDCPLPTEVHRWAVKRVI